MSTPLPKMGDRIRVSIPHNNDSTEVRVFTVRRIDTDNWVTDGAALGAYWQDPFICEILEAAPAPIPQPTGIGAVIEDNDGDKWLRVGPDDWRYITAKGTPGYATGVTWATLLEDYSSDVTIVSDGVAP